MTIIDAAEATSELAIEALQAEGLAKTEGEGKVTICGTADIERVQRLAQRMLPIETCQFREINLQEK